MAMPANCLNYIPDKAPSPAARVAGRHASQWLSSAKRALNARARRSTISRTAGEGQQHIYVMQPLGTPKPSRRLSARRIIRHAGQGMRLNYGT